MEKDPLMTTPITLNPMAPGALRLTARPATQHTEPQFGASARQANTANVCDPASIVIGGTVAVVTGIASLLTLGLARKLFTPAELKPHNITDVLVAKDANSAVIPNALTIKSHVGDKDVDSVLTFQPKSGFLGLFKKATWDLKTDPPQTKSVRMFLLPPYLNNLLRNGPDELGSPRNFTTINAEQKLGDVTVPAKARVGRNVYGESIALYKDGEKFVIVSPEKIGQDGSPYVAKTYDKIGNLPQPILQRVLGRPSFGPVI